MNTDIKMLNDRVALITGGTRGIGYATCRALARHSVRLIVTGRSRSELNRIAMELESIGAPKVIGLECDLSDLTAATEIFENALAAFGHIDILVNNAGDRGPAMPLLELDEQDIVDLYTVNLVSPSLLCRYALRHMTTRGRGHIVNVLSSACLHPMCSYSVYTAAKRGLEGLSRVLMKEAKPFGVKVSILFPGSTDTTFKFGPDTPFLKAEQVANAIVTILNGTPDAVIQEMVLRPLADNNY